ncbi:hypothetical protein D3C73_1342170 [compost metagenome]
MLPLLLSEQNVDQHRMAEEAQHGDADHDRRIQSDTAGIQNARPERQRQSRRSAAQRFHRRLRRAHRSLSDELIRV